MKHCLCCGKPLKATATESEQNSGWHTSCVRNFFGTSQFPDIDVSEEVMHQLAIEHTNKGYTVTGVQKKLSLHLSKDSKPRLTLVNYPTGYILKPQTEEYPALPEMEYLIMQMAVLSGIKTVPHALLRLSSQNDALCYITKRIDRVDNQMLAMEDFCQLDGRLTEDKYRGSYERCGKIIAKYSISKGFDTTELFLRIVFSFAVGNSDMHLKNFSLIESQEGNQKYALSAAYDMLSTNVVLPADQEQFALTMNGKKQSIRRKDFMVFAETIGIPKKSAEKMIAKIISLKEKYIEMCRGSYLPDNMKERLEALMEQRIAVLSE